MCLGVERWRVIKQRPGWESHRGRQAADGLSVPITDPAGQYFCTTNHQGQSGSNARSLVLKCRPSRTEYRIEHRMAFGRAKHQSAQARRVAWHEKVSGFRGAGIQRWYVRAMPIRNHHRHLHQISRK